MSNAGFTLLEMLFVMFVIGLLASLTVPRFSAAYQSRQLLGQRGDIEDQLRELPRRVRLAAQALVLPGDAAKADFDAVGMPLRLAEGWDVTFTPPLEVSMMGVCSASVVQIANPAFPDMAGRYQIAQSTCELSLLAN
jgi:prepilin-type N-terminal cleavage/methylation domain-containing protein